MVKNSLELAKLIAKASDDKKARDVVMMNMEGLTTATDYFVVCSASSTTQVRAIADNVEDVLREQEGMELPGLRVLYEGMEILEEPQDITGIVESIESIDK